MRLLVISWNGGGNVPPAFGIADELRRRGHQVVFAGQELEEPAGTAPLTTYDTLERRCIQRGFDFLPLERSAARWRAEPPSGRRIATAMMACAEHLLDVEEVTSGGPWDAVLVDCLMFGALAALQDAALPLVVLVHSAPGLLMAPGGSFEALLLAEVNQVRAMARLAALTRLWDAWAAFPTLCTTIAPLDPLAAQAPSSFDYIGPVFERTAPSSWRSPWRSEDSRPLVLVSFTTNPAWDQTSRIQRTLAALATRPYRILVTASLADLSALDVPDNAVVVRHVPHGEVLPHVSVTVTHAGHGTVATCLANGVPVVSLPNPAADQPPLAAQVQRLGAGRALDGEAATPADIGLAVEEILSDPSYATVAAQLRDAIAATDAASTAATRLEWLAS
ncbi:MAG: glycosyltransferase [Actinomycetota bacterium]|nr:glycosyltransferase [Actinomycetota bacterium]